jgi:transcriptional regulator with XRE-family HTH domain
MSRRDTNTLNLFEWEPPELVKSYDEQRVRSASLRSRISRSVSETLRLAKAEKGLDRKQVAEQMSVWLEEDVSPAMLDAYASEAKEEHTISLLRTVALVHVTGDMRPLQMIAEMHGYAVVESKYLPWIDYGMAADRKSEMDKELEAMKRAARKGYRL